MRTGLDCMVSTSGGRIAPSVCITTFRPAWPKCGGKPAPIFRRYLKTVFDIMIRSRITYGFRPLSQYTTAIATYLCRSSDADFGRKTFVCWARRLAASSASNFFFASYASRSAIPILQ